MRFAAVLALAALTLLAAVLALVAPTACVPPPPRPAHTVGTESRVQRPPPNAPPDPIGTTRPGDRSCTETRDCKAGDICFAPDSTPAAAAAAAQCKKDPQCPSGELCNGTCTPPCTATSCDPGHTCRDGHCAPIPCTDPQASICPQNFRCAPGSGACEREACTARSQCDAGVCFHGQCFAHDAYCAPPVAPPESRDPK